jgi:hypothetical protein
MQLYAENLDKKDFFGKSDPYFVVSKMSPAGTYSVVYRSEVIKNTLNPTWKPFQLPVVELCNGDYDRKLKIDVYDWDSNGSHDFIGSLLTTLHDLSIAVVEKKTFPCVNEAKKKKSRCRFDETRTSAEMFSAYFGILGKVWNFGQSLEFWAKFGILGKVWNFGQSLEFWANFGILGNISSKNQTNTYLCS